MGGSAFTDLTNPSKSLYTPRMPLRIYQYSRDRALHILDRFYAHANCTIEAPGKADYGDVDILVTSPRDQADTNTATLAAALGATQYKKNNFTTNFALPWPSAEELNATSLAQDAIMKMEPKVVGSSLSTSSKTSGLDALHNIGSDIAGTQRYIQLDLHACPTMERFNWELFHQAHGDLWNILGAMIRPYGLVVNDVGLYLRLAGVDGISKEQRMIQLTISPSAVLGFLHLDDSYCTPFESLDAMFAYAASCRFYDPKAYEGREDLKANDRLRMKKRPMFLKWYEGYLQGHREDEPGRSAGTGREEVIEEAKRFFGVEMEYEEKRAKGFRLMGVEKLWSDIRKGLPLEGLRIGVVMRGVKREVVGRTMAANQGTDVKKEVAGRAAEAPDVKELDIVQQAYVDGRFDEIAEWVKVDWENIERRQNEYEREQSTKHLLAKLERDKAKPAAAYLGEPESGVKTAGASTFEAATMREALGKG